LNPVFQAAIHPDAALRELPWTLKL